MRTDIPSTPHYPGFHRRAIRALIAAVVLGATLSPRAAGSQTLESEYDPGIWRGVTTRYQH
jgi:hypothetical protein